MYYCGEGLSGGEVAKAFTDTQKRALSGNIMYVIGH